MAVEYRPARAEEMPAFIYNSRVGFGENLSEESLARATEHNRVRPEWTRCAFEDGEIAAQMATIPFVMRWNGRDIDCGGVTAVSTLPSHRRRGHLRRMMTRTFAEMREGGQPVAMLWASMAAIYQRFGYGVGFTRFVCDFDPRQVSFVDDIPVPGRTRLMKAGEALPYLEQVYARYAAPRTLMLVRESDRWTDRVLRPWRAELGPLLIALYEEAGEPLGYVIYRVEQRREDRPVQNQRIEVSDYAWLTPAAHRALVSYLIGYDLVGSVQFWRMPVDDPLFVHTQEPRILGLRVTDGTLVRVVDLPAALEGRGYDADGRLRFSFADDLCPWNNGVWELTVEGGAGRLKPAEGEADLTLTPRALAMLVSGCQPATTLAHAGLIPPADGRVLASADQLFRTAYAPLCTDGF